MCKHFLGFARYSPEEVTFTIPALDRVRQSTSALSTSVGYPYRRGCQALTVEVTEVAEAELMLGPWHCRVSSAEHLCTSLNPETEILKAMIHVGLISRCA